MTHVLKCYGHWREELRDRDSDWLDCNIVRNYFISTEQEDVVATVESFLRMNKKDRVAWLDSHELDRSCKSKPRRNTSVEASRASARLYGKSSTCLCLW